MENIIGQHIERFDESLLGEGLMPVIDGNGFIVAVSDHAATQAVAAFPFRADGKLFPMVIKTRRISVIESRRGVVSSVQQSRLFLITRTEGGSI